jgi:hypothetical protein
MPPNTAQLVTVARDLPNRVRHKVRRVPDDALTVQVNLAKPAKAAAKAVARVAARVAAKADRAVARAKVKAQ